MLPIVAVGISLGLALSVVVCLVAALQPSEVARPATRDHHGGRNATGGGVLLVVLREVGVAGSATATLARCGVEVVREIPAIGVCTARGDDDVAARLRRLPDVAGVLRFEPVIDTCGERPPRALTKAAAAALAELGRAAIAKAAAAGEDPYSGLQWNLNAIHARQAWAAGQRGRGVRIALLDTGCDPTHPDLAPNVDRALARSFVPGQSWDTSTDAVRTVDHGTRMAGIIAAAENGLGIVGVAPEAEIVPVQVLPRPSGMGPPDAVLEGIVYAAAIGAQVVNMSLAYDRRHAAKPSQTPDDMTFAGPDATVLAVAFARATEYAHARGCTLVAAAGNRAVDRDHDRDAMVLPADAPHVISVAATGPLGWATNPATDLDVPAVYSNYGCSAIDLAAPGGNQLAGLPEFCTVGPVVLPCFIFDFVPTTEAIEVQPPYGPFAYASGTSAAAAHVSAVAALVIGSRGGPSSPQLVERILRASAVDFGAPGRDPRYGHGRVDAERAVR